MNKHVYLYDVNYLYKCMYAYKSPSVNKQTYVENPGKPTMCRSFPKRLSPWVLHFFFTVYPRARNVLDHNVNGNFRILKWRYCTIYDHILWGYSLT